MDRSASNSRPDRKPKIVIRADLSDYLRGDGIPSACTTSNFGAMCDRLAVMGIAEVSCPACRARRRRRARRRVTETPEQKARRERTRAIFRAAGWSLAEATRELEAIEDSNCRRCAGTGTVVARITQAMRDNPEIDAFPMGSTKHGRPPETIGDTDELERIGRVGNLLARMRERDPEAAEALRRWGSPGGATLSSLMDLNEPGRMLLKHFRADLPPVKAFENERRRRSRGFPDHVRDRLFERAEAEARLLLECAVMLWNELVEAAAREIEDRKAAAIRDEARAQLSGMGSSR